MLGADHDTEVSETGAPVIDPQFARPNNLVVYPVEKQFAASDALGEIALDPGTPVAGPGGHEVDGLPVIGGAGRDQFDQ